MSGVRIEPASFYPHERGSVLVPLPLLPLPERVEVADEEWERKREFHVTAVSSAAVAARLRRERGTAEADALDAAWEAIAAVVSRRSAGAVTLRDELRVVHKGDERTIVAMADVEGLAELHDELAARLQLDAEPPPAHVTLYTRPGGAAIGLHSHADLERLSSRLAGHPFAWPPPLAAGSRESSLDLALRFAAAVNSRDIPPDLLTPDFVMENVATAVTDKTYRGTDGLREWTSDFFDVLDDGRFEAEPIDAGDDWALGRLRIVGRGSASGAPVDMPYYGVMWIRNGRICRAVGYGSRREALAAVGITPGDPGNARGSR